MRNASVELITGLDQLITTVTTIDTTLNFLKGYIPRVYLVDSQFALRMVGGVRVCMRVYK